MICIKCKDGYINRLFLLRYFYVYEGDELPADFICPWCKHPASDFKLVE